MQLLKVLILCSFATLWAAPYCAFEVKVKKPSGVPFARVQVGLVKQGTQIQTVETDHDGMARLCDAPLQAVDIAVGVDLCGLVVIKNVKATWPTTRKVFATYVETWCPHFDFADHCQVLLRIEDEKKRPVANAQLDARPSERDVSDVFGRIFRTLKRGEVLEGLVTKAGYEQARVLERCTSLGEDTVEVKVALRKR